MSDTYCGKSCMDCSYREELDCRGCKMGPGREITGDCEVAQCCRMKSHNNCGTCEIKGRCSKIGNLNNIPSERIKKAKELAVKNVELLTNAILLHKWTDILFKVIIASVVFNLLTNLMSDSSAMSIVTNVAEGVIGIAYGCVLIILSKTNRKFFISGLVMVLFKTVYLITLYCINSPDKMVVLTISLVLLVFGMWGEYNEFVAHAEVIADYDADMSDKWVKLWNWYLISACATIAGLFIGAIIALIAAIATIVISILKIVYLRKNKEIYDLYIIKNR